VQVDWVLLSYRLPREPSTPRIALWRQLRKLGALQLGHGLAAMPLDDRSREHFGWLADGVIESGGDAFVFVAQASTKQEQQALEALLSAARPEASRA
jgi:Protein ChrB, N-terminal